MYVAISIEALRKAWVACARIGRHEPTELAGVPALVGIVEADRRIGWVACKALARLGRSSIFAIREEAVRTGLDRRTLIVLFFVDALGSEIDLRSRRRIAEYVGLASRPECGCIQCVGAQ